MMKGEKKVKHPQRVCALSIAEKGIAGPASVLVERLTQHSRSLWASYYKTAIGFALLLSSTVIDSCAKCDH